MPSVKQYKKGSIIYFDGEIKDQNAYLLKSGNCTRTKLSIETLENVQTKLIVGEFFGIKAPLGIHMRDETISVLSDSVVYIFSPAEFDAIIKKKVNIIFKMLKAFSNELRQIHYAIEDVLQVDSDEEGVVGRSGKLLGIGQYYVKMKKYPQAKYAFEKFIEHYADDVKVADAQKYLKKINDHLANGGNGSVSLSDDAPIEASVSALNNIDYSVCESEESYAAEEVTDPLSQSFFNLSEAYAKGLFEKSWNITTEILSKIKDLDKEGSLYEKIYLAEIRLNYYGGHYKECIEKVKEFIKSYKRSKWVAEAMICIAESYKKQNDLPKTKAVYMKVLDVLKNSDNTSLKEEVNVRLKTVS